MRVRTSLVIGLLCHAFIASAQTDETFPDSTTIIGEEPVVTQEYLDSVNASYSYSTGIVPIADGAATLAIPATFKFLDAAQSHQLMVELWENPPSVAENIGGLIFPVDAGVFDGSFSFSISYDTVGYVSDRDADALDYTAMLKEMRRNDSLDNIQRVASGYAALRLVGWASPPHYDKQRKALHWAQEFERDSDTTNVLNYNIRVLGRRGLIILNAMGTMEQLDSVKATIPVILDMIAFNDGYRYDQFNASTDKVADWTIGGLIDGKIKEKIADVINVMKIAGIAFLLVVIVLAVVVFLVVRRKSRIATP